jgi:hypothetical protein
MRITPSGAATWTWRRYAFCGDAENITQTGDETMTNLIFARGDDWEGIYIGDKLITEGHSIDPLDAVKIALAHGATSADSGYCDLNWLHDRGDLPQSLAEVKWYARPDGKGAIKVKSA